MKKAESALRIIESLIQNGSLKIENLSEATKIPKKEVLHILRELEFLGYVLEKNETVFPSSQIYSLLFDPIFASKGLTQYFERNFDTNVVREIKTIPGLLAPILLLRAFAPYVSFILKDLKKEGKLQIAKTKEDFLLKYFSRPFLDFKPLNDWEQVFFDSEEFYDIWILLNEELVKRIRLSPNNIDAIQEQVSSAKINTSNRMFVTSPSLTPKEHQNSLEMAKKTPDVITLEIAPKTILKITKNSLPLDIEKLRTIDVSIPNLLKFVREQNSRRKGLVITQYSDSLSWEFTGEKIKVPRMFLLHDGIYIEKSIKTKFTEVQIANQASYLEKYVRISQDWYGSQKIMPEKEKNVGI